MLPIPRRNVMPAPGAGPHPPVRTGQPGRQPPPVRDQPRDFRRGTMLDALPPMNMTAEASCCETFIGLFFGFEPAEHQLLDECHDRLMGLCGGLPAGVPGSRGLHRRIVRFHGEVSALLAHTVRPFEREDTIERMRQLCETAVQLERDLAAREHTLQRQNEARRLNPVGPLQMLPRPDRSFVADADDGSDTGPDEAEAPVPLPRPVPRRRQALPEPEVAARRPAVPPPAPYDLGEDARAAIRQALDAADAAADGAGRISAVSSMALGRALVQPFHGTFLGRTSRSVHHRDRWFTIRETIDRATQHLDAPATRAVRAYALEHLRRRGER